MKNKIELIPVNEFGSEITVGGYGFDKFIEKPKPLTDLEIAIKLEEIEREEVMKTFEDLIFTEEGSFFGVRSVITFENGYGASVLKGPLTYVGKQGLYELAVFKDGSICYDTPITSDVIGYLRPEDVTDVMEKIQKL